jgi:hypothetical protein
MLRPSARSRLIEIFGVSGPLGSPLALVLAYHWGFSLL